MTTLNITLLIIGCASAIALAGFVEYFSEGCQDEE